MVYSESLNGTENISILYIMLNSRPCSHITFFSPFFTAAPFIYLTFEFIQPILKRRENGLQIVKYEQTFKLQQEQDLDRDEWLTKPF